ncbi:MAG TPA: exodeoxyribonuclease V subunit alpha, partial [Desulfurivibrionaceae bacterium]|nr:exodeoxyribonuclease V subunit alpha [Desulfurivibrionaceae bacterium]
LAALASHQVGRGHVCIDLKNLLANAGNTLSLPPEDATAADPKREQNGCPSPADPLAGVSMEAIMSALEASMAVSDGSLTTPLVVNGTRLYLRRFWRYEKHIADGIRNRLAETSALDDPEAPTAQTLASALKVLFPPGKEVDYQKLACALAARSRFAVITGGPGTGKTTTVVNLLAALQAVAGEDRARDGRKYRIRLAAPTGKAAARLNESIGGAVSRLPLTQLPGQVLIDDIPTRVTTLHRLLGSRPDSRRFRHNRDNPLLVDILVIDEASMVDVDLMASVFEALPEHAQLILLGDKDQLASVDAGAVLGELCQRARDAHYRPDTAHWLERVTGQALPEDLVDPQGQALDQAVAMLRKSYRFSEGSGIRQLAEAVNTNTLDAAMLEQCRRGYFEDVIWLNGEGARRDP